VVIFRLFEISEAVGVNDADTGAIFCCWLELTNINVIISIVVLNADGVVKSEAGELAQFDFQS
jgi:hypothetical protein